MKTVQANLLTASEMSFHSSFFNQGCSSFQNNWILYPLRSTILRFAVSAFLCLLLSGKLKRGGSVKMVGIGLDCSLNRSCHPSKYHRTSASGTMKSLPVSKFLRLQQFNQLMAELHFVVKFTKFLSPTFVTLNILNKPLTRCHGMAGLLNSLLDVSPELSHLPWRCRILPPP